MSLNQQHILLGVTGGIAAYKACQLVRQLRQQGAEVRVVMTEKATRFVGEATFQALSGEPVHTCLFDSSAAMGMGHIELARWADTVMVVPATADFISRLAQGRADDLLTTLCLVTEAPLVVAPAMNHCMWKHAATIANVGLLRQRGVRFLGPVSGPLAEGESGLGRMIEPEDMLKQLERPVVAQALAGETVLISAGPTFEDIDPVRFIGNRSSGRMGFALAQAAADAGAEVTLVAGPVCLPTPTGIRQRIDVRSAAQMQAAVMQACVAKDIFISAAAVGDYRPANKSPCKIKKKGAEDGLTLELVQNPDIVTRIAAAADRPFVVGFAAETHDVHTHAQDKLKRKGLDMIAANQVGDQLGFECLDNQLTLYWENGKQSLPRMKKTELAQALLACVVERLHESRGQN